MMGDLQALIHRREDLRTVFGTALWTSVEVNGLLIRAQSLHGRLHQFGQNLIHYTYVPEYEVQLIGSASGLFFRDEYFLVSTAHQVRNIDERNVGVVVAGQNKYVSSAGFVRIDQTSSIRDHDGTDLVAFNFSEQVRTGSVPKTRFFSLGIGGILEDSDDVVAFLGYGCPFCDQKYNVVDDNHLGTVVRSMTFEPDVQPYDPTLGSCRLIAEMDFDPNGLSGGPMFAVVMQKSKLQLRFAGIINRAGGGRVYFIKAMVLLKLLDLSFTEAQVRS